MRAGLSSDEGITLDTVSFRISLRWRIHIINPIDKNKLSCNTSTDAAPQFFQKLTPFICLTSEREYSLKGKRSLRCTTKENKHFEILKPRVVFRFSRCHFKKAVRRHFFLASFILIPRATYIGHFELFSCNPPPCVTLYGRLSDACG